MPIITRSAKRGLFALPVALLIAAGPSLAEPQQNETVITAAHGDGLTTRSTRISYRDLNLSDPRDQRQLSRRISAAADAICANEADQLWNKFEGIDQRRCYDNAVTTALAHIPGASAPARD